MFGSQLAANNHFIKYQILGCWACAVIGTRTK